MNKQLFIASDKLYKKLKMELDDFKSALKIKSPDEIIKSAYELATKEDILTIFVGVYFLIIGAQKINYSLLLKKYHESCWPLVLVMGIFFVVISIITFFINGNGVINGVGIGLMGYGLIDLVNTILLRKRSQYFLA